MVVAHAWRSPPRYLGTEPYHDVWSEPWPEDWYIVDYGKNRKPRFAMVPGGPAPFIRFVVRIAPLNLEGE